MMAKNIVHVAVAVIQNSEGQYFIAKRPKDVHQGGLWEFPGGKVESNESVFDALKRELFEEIGITLHQGSASPLIRIHHDYSDKSVLLDVWNVKNFSGNAFGKEGQETLWINNNNFHLYDFPLANAPIIKALHLPDSYMITGKFSNEDDLLFRVLRAIKNGIRLIQFRAHDLSEEDYCSYSKKIYTICEKEKVQLLLNTSIEKYTKHDAHKFSHGIHLSSKEIKCFSNKSLDKKLLISTSTHNKEELQVAEKNNVDFVVLSPVNKTLTHPEAIPLGWELFRKLCDDINIPIYALGGMKKELMGLAKTNGAQGIAAIGEFWNE